MVLLKYCFYQYVLVGLLTVHTVELSSINDLCLCAISKISVEKISSLVVICAISRSQYVASGFMYSSKDLIMSLVFFVKVPKISSYVSSGFYEKYQRSHHV